MSKSRPYPLEYRRRIVELVRAGRSPKSCPGNLNRRRSAFGIGSRRRTATRVGGPMA